MLCNDISEFSKIHKAVNQRVKVVPFKRKFVNNPTLPHERQINYYLVKELATLEVKQAFTLLSFLRVVKWPTDEFTATNNPILEFIESIIEKGVHGSVQCNDMYNVYVQYRREC